jgi:hypothetical protein
MGEKIDPHVSHQDHVVPQEQVPVEPPAMQQDTLQQAQGEESVESSHPPPEPKISPFGTGECGRTILSKKFIQIMRQNTAKPLHPILDVLVVGLESALCYNEIPSVLGLPRIQDIQTDLPAISSLLIDVFHEYLGDITTSNLRDFDVNQALFDNDCDGRGMEGKISVERSCGPPDFFFHIKNSHQVEHATDNKPRSIGPRYKLNPQAPSEIPGLDKKLRQFNRNREQDQWLSAVYLGSMLLCILLEKHDAFFNDCFNHLRVFINTSDVLYNKRKILFEREKFVDFRYDLCSVMDKYVDMLRRYLSWRFQEAKKELREAFVGCGNINPLHYISVDRNYVGAHPITSDLNFDQRKNKNVSEQVYREHRELSQEILFQMLHIIVEKEGLYYSPNVPIVRKLKLGYRLGKSHYTISSSCYNPLIFSYP